MPECVGLNIQFHGNVSLIPRPPVFIFLLSVYVHIVKINGGKNRGDLGTRLVKVSQYICHTVY